MTCSEPGDGNPEPALAAEATIDLRAAHEGAGIEALLAQLDRELIGLRRASARSPRCWW
jgi:hypothetical protein